MLDENACTRHWSAAEAKDRRIRDAHRITVDNKYCYNPNIYSTKGWCELADDESKWGICSVSCHEDFIKVIFGSNNI